jgi:ArsR family transcriptional regulator, arsenate/arsenite/antimonite-responsive transcriptional repressor
MVVDAKLLPTPTDAEACCLPRRLSATDEARAAQVAELARALSDPIRVQIVGLLADNRGRVCQCDLQPLFAVSQPTLSHHLRRLEAAALIEVERRGRWAYYSLRPETLEVLRRWLS